MEVKVELEGGGDGGKGLRGGEGSYGWRGRGRKWAMEHNISTSLRAGSRGKGVRGVLMETFLFVLFGGQNFVRIGSDMHTSSVSELDNGACSL